MSFFGRLFNRNQPEDNHGHELSITLAEARELAEIDGDAIKAVATKYDVREE